jgi:hypothetical protein
MRGERQPLGIPARNADDVLLWLPRLVETLNERMEQGARLGMWLHLRDLPEAERRRRERKGPVACMRGLVGAVYGTIMHRVDTRMV